MSEIRALVEGFPDAGVNSDRWRTLAKRKLTEVEALIAQAESMKRLLEESLDSGRATLDACTVVLARRNAADAAGAG